MDLDDQRVASTSPNKGSWNESGTGDGLGSVKRCAEQAVQPPTTMKKGWKRMFTQREQLAQLERMAFSWNGLAWLILALLVSARKGYGKVLTVGGDELRDIRVQPQGTECASHGVECQTAFVSLGFSLRVVSLHFHFFPLDKDKPWKANTRARTSSPFNDSAQVTS